MNPSTLIPEGQAWRICTWDARSGNWITEPACLTTAEAEAVIAARSACGETLYASRI